MLKTRGPSLVLAGASAQGQEHGYETVAAAMMLNIMLGNVGKTIQGGDEVPFQQLHAKIGNTRDLLAFADALEKDALDVVFFYGANPVYTAPGALKLDDKLARVDFKVSLSQFEDETTAQADLVLPLLSQLEDWGTHVSPVQTGTSEISMQQPLMERLYPETRGFGDVVLDLLKLRKSNAYSGFDDYYAYLRNAVSNMPASSKKDSGDVWSLALQNGLLGVNGKSQSLRTRAVAMEMPANNVNQEYPLTLIPSARLGLWDGRHANLPWLQEAPDQISKVVWDSWAELHPITAARLGVKQGDSVRITSNRGTIEARVYIYKGINKDAVAVPLGQGHDGYGRYADGLGVNPLKILNPVTDRKTGELAMFATRVSVSAAGNSSSDKLVRMGGSDTQVGRKLVATVTADVFERTEGGA
jgi:molybdopterin-containing oxidoreductase family iron-sulfur binding subunit